MLLEELWRYVRRERLEKLFLARQLLRPFLRFDRKQCAYHFRRKSFQTFQIQILRSRHTPDRALPRAAAPFAAINNPFQDTHVVAKTRPEKLALRVFAKPIDVKNQRRIRQARAGFEPVPEVLADVVAAEG